MDLQRFQVVLLNYKAYINFYLQDILFEFCDICLLYRSIEVLSYGI